jgi:dsDNA-specific endonuclease/ATPase MutS2
MKIGDHGVIIDGVEQGQIVAIDGDVVTLSVDEMLLQFPRSSVLLKQSFDYGELPELNLTEKTKQVFKPSKDPELYVIDLHLSALPSLNLGLEPMAHQLACLKQSLLLARRSNNQRVLINHGVGQGKLKAAIDRFLKQTGQWRIVSRHEAWGSEVIFSPDNRT